MTQNLARVIASAVQLGMLCALAGGQGTPQQSAIELVRQTVENEIRSNNGGAKFMFKDYRESPRGSQTKLIVETADATAGMLIAVNGKPLTPEQRAAEEARLDGLAHNPADLRKKQKAEREDTERTVKIMQALPDAFIYHREGAEVGSQGVGNPGDTLVKLTFRANPKYMPPSHTEQVLTGMAGYILIDENRHRIAKIDGTLFKDVEFGWGILGRLDKGGRFVVQQGTVGNGDWEVTRMDLDFIGKVLLFKKLVIKSNESFSDFRPAPPNLTFAQAVELLKKQQGQLAENGGQGASESRDPK